MAEIINSTYITLDGVIEHPEDWPDMGGFGAEGNRIQTDLVLGCSAVIMGRRTYESFAPVWPTLMGNPLGDKMNEMPKYVASTTLEAPSWNNTHVIKGDLVEFATRLRAEAEGDVVQFGFGPITQTLLDAGLVDRFRLWLHPVLMGTGGAQDLLYGKGPRRAGPSRSAVRWSRGSWYWTIGPARHDAPIGAAAETVRPDADASLRPGRRTQVAA